MNTEQIDREVEYEREELMKKTEREFYYEPQDFATTKEEVEKRKFIQSFSQEYITDWVEQEMLSEFIRRHKKQYEEFVQIPKRVKHDAIIEEL